MLRALLAKDLRRAWRNPLPWLLNLALPLCITAVIGLVFGGHGDNNNRLGRIRFAVVDEDHSALSKLLRGAAGQDQAATYLDPVFLEKAEALRQLNDSKISAALIIPPQFTSNYLTGQPVRLELVKNPAEQIHPAVLEELLGVAVTGLNAVSRNFTSEFPAWRRVAEGRADYHEIAQLIDDTGRRAQAVRHYLFPPLISFTGASAEKKETPAPEPAGPQFNLFAYLLVGMAGMFLLLLANQGVSDLHRELALRTFERYSTLHVRLLPFILGKALFTIVIVALGSVILLGGGAALFHIHWPRPLPLAALTAAYVCFATGLMSVLVSLAADERQANALNNVVSMVFAMAGGCMFPPDNLPAVMRDHLCPLLPTYWYSNTARQLWWSDGAWEIAAAKLLLLGFVCLTITAFIFRRRFQEGVRA
ncbi:MAG TPA: ABC transporter permease [Verrucomicrobiae bacterium]|nr:ABC transporter permease [Verrucomicrobiae bacterium]